MDFGIRGVYILENDFESSCRFDVLRKVLQHHGCELHVVKDDAVELESNDLTGRSMINIIERYRTTVKNQQMLKKLECIKDILEI